ncbi:HAD family hydrolase [Fictibacillus fluitans]|uniref:HAD family hydrolase n=1 Tax=Fictibacillus fluitans TaxID=3058422 RepID=A0ABT8HXD5_9BACL|nr:HAD family hydrolase [Fictibacillus sp. NE201]MDN4525379.1 HAD family hydrolase [Fictibacillus sp. NE201]
MKVDAVFFDLDNTLYDYERVFRLAAIQSFAELWNKGDITGEAASAEQWFRRFKSCCDRHWGEYESGRLSRSEYQKKRLLESLKESGLQFASLDARSFEHLLRQFIPSFCVLFNGMDGLLEVLKDHQILTGIITNGEEELQKKKITSLSLEQWIPSNCIFISGTMSLKKPNPQIFSLVQRESGCNYPLYVGDTWELDIQPAQKAGWEAIWVTPKSKNGRNGQIASSIFQLREMLISYIE